jgi:hypothetical protein
MYRSAVAVAARNCDFLAKVLCVSISVNTLQATERLSFEGRRSDYLILLSAALTGHVSCVRAPYSN